MPPPDLELSVAHVDGLNEPQIWRLATRILADGKRKTALGRGELLAADFINFGLNVLRDDEPFRHTKVVGWPNVVDGDKAAQIQIAQELAAIAKLKLNPLA